MAVGLGSLAIPLARSRLDDHPLARWVPPERHGADPKRIDERFLQLVGGRAPAPPIGTGATGLHGVEQGAQTAGQGLHLYLRKRTAHECATLTGLQEEGARSGRADGARHESVRVIELKEVARHGGILSRTRR